MQSGCGIWRQQQQRRWRGCVLRAGMSGICCCCCRRLFGNAPSRVRPVETPRECAWQQSGREVSAIVAIAMMFVVPVWLLVLSSSQGEQRRDAVREWAERQQRGGSE